MTSPKLFGALVVLLTAVPVAVLALFYSCRAAIGALTMSSAMIVWLICAVAAIVLLIVCGAVMKQGRLPYV